MREVSTLRLLLAAALTGGILLEGRLSLSPYTVWCLSLPILVWCACPFYFGLLRGFREQKANTDMLVSLGIWAAFLYSTVAIFDPGHLLPEARRHHLDAMGLIVVLTILGRWWEIRLTGGREESLGRIMRRIPRTARRLGSGGGSGRNVPLDEISPGERILIKPGEQVPVDGEVVEGRSSVDESLWTGSDPAVEKTVGSKVLSGTQNKSGTMTVIVERVGPRSLLAHVVGQVREGFTLKAVRAGIADGLAAGYVPAIVIFAVGAALLWSWKGPEPRLGYAFTAMLSILIAGCPWAVTLASPFALAFGLRCGNRKGLRFRNPGVLEKLAHLDSVILDKRGILTEGRPDVRSVIAFGRWTESDILRHAAILEQSTGHPFSFALARKLNGATLPAAQSRETSPGRGVSIRLDGERILAGSVRWLEESGVRVSAGVVRRLNEAQGTLMAVAIDGKIAGAVTFTDRVRPGVREAVRELESMGIEVILASGDRNAAAHEVAHELGIRRVYSEVGSGDKVKIISELQDQGKKVVMIGEGMRDAAALSRADLGMAGAMDTGAETSRTPVLGASIDLGAEAADIVLVRRGLEHALSALRLSLEIREVIRQNLKWVFGLHIVLIPLAAGAFILSAGVRLTAGSLAATAGLSLAAIFLNSAYRFR